jgi:hypothetical protein
MFPRGRGNGPAREKEVEQTIGLNVRSASCVIAKPDKPFDIDRPATLESALTVSDVPADRDY